MDEAECRPPGLDHVGVVVEVGHGAPEVARGEEERHTAGRITLRLILLADIEAVTTPV